MVALALNPLAAEFRPCVAPPGLMEGPPGVHTVVDDSLENFSPPPGLPTPPGLTLPPGLSAPPGLPCPQHLAPKQTVSSVSLHDCLADGRDSEKHVAGEKPPGVFAPPSSPPGKFASTGPPGVFFLVDSKAESTCLPPPGLWQKDLDGLSAGDVSTDVESDTASVCDVMSTF